MPLRNVLFWLHLAAGLIAGLIIGLLCATGTALAFEKQLLAWAERDVRLVATPPAGAAPLPLAELTERVRQADPTRPQAITVSADPRAAVAFTLNRETTLYANPFTGEVRRAPTTALHRFLRTMLAWHRWLALDGDQRPVGKAVTGAANLVFLFLAVSGLYLWWPRTLSWRGVRAVAVLNWRLTGRSRDFNWHNTIGLWSAPVLIVLTLTALPISYRWAAELTYTLTRTPLPASGPQSSGAPPPAAEVPAPAEGARPVPLATLLAAAQAELPRWTSLTVRPPARIDPAQPTALSIVAREAGTWPRTATTTLQYDPYTGALLQRDGYADLSAARQIRAWSRYLHTGEALGWAGQLIAGLASLGGCFLVYTGFALAWRRFLPAKKPDAPAGG